MPTRQEVPATATPASPTADHHRQQEDEDDDEDDLLQENVGGGGVRDSIASSNSRHSQSVSPDAEAEPTMNSHHRQGQQGQSQSQSQSHSQDGDDDDEDDDGLLFSCRCESARSVTTLLSCLRHVASGGSAHHHSHSTSDAALTQGGGRRSRADLSLSAIDHTGISGGRGGGGSGAGRGKAQHATVFAGEAGLTFHVHGTARQSQASVDMQAGLFSDYYVCEQVVEIDDEDDDGDEEENVSGSGTKTEVVKGGEFCINLTTVLECLHVLGTNALDRTKLCLSYDLHDAIFRIELLEDTHGATGGGIVSTCAIPGLAVSDDYDDDSDEEGNGASGLAIAFRSSPIVARAIVKSDYLRDAVVELSDVPGAAAATIGISPKGIDLAALGYSTECQVSLPHAGNGAVFVSLECDPPKLHARTYPLHSVLSAFRGLEIASETCISINRRGMVAIQHQVVDEHVGNGQPNFVDFIMGCLQDDDEDSDDDGYSDEEDGVNDVVVELGREMLTSGTQRSLEEARARRRRGRHQEQQSAMAGAGTYASSGDEGEEEEEEAKRREAEDMLKRLGNESSSDEEDEDGEGGGKKTKKSKTKDGESEYAQLTMEPTSKSQRDQERKRRGRRNRGGAKKKAGAEDDDDHGAKIDDDDWDTSKKSSKKKKKKDRKEKEKKRGRKRPSPTTASGRSKSRRKKSDGDEEADASNSPSRSPEREEEEESEPETDVDSQFYKIGEGNGAAGNNAQDCPSSPELMYGDTSLGGPSTSMIGSRKSANFDDDSDDSF